MDIEKFLGKHYEIYYWSQVELDYAFELYCADSETEGLAPLGKIEFYRAVCKGRDVKMGRIGGKTGKRVFCGLRSK